MIRGTQLLTFLESTQAALNAARIVEQGGRKIPLDPKTGKRVLSFREAWRANLGLVADHNGLRLDRDRRALDAREVSFGEVAQTFLGRHLGVQEIFEACNAQLREGEGGLVVLPSHFANISAFRDTVAGLLDAMTLEAFQNVEFIGDKVAETEDARINGGKGIGVRGAGGESEPLNDGEAAPMNGLKETYIDIPDNYRWAEAIAVNSKVFLYDRTGQVQEAADFVGTKIGRAKEINIARTVMGMDNNFAQDGKSANTYQTAATDLPNDYVNAEPNELNSWPDLDRAIQTLAKNKDPHTGWEIALQKPFALIVAPDREMTVNTVLRAVTIRQADASDLINVRYGPNPLPPFEIMSSMIWWNLLVNSAGTDPATDRWFMGNFKKAFKFRVVSPFQTQDDPTEVSVRKDVMMCRVASLWGRAYTKNPRYTYEGTSE